MLRALTIGQRSFPLNAPFRISRGVKRAADVVTAELRQADCTGRGEAVPYARYGENAESVLAQMESAREALDAGMGRDELQARLPHGAARNALDLALWDLESKLTGVPVAARLARPPRSPIATALTVGIDTPERMVQAASRFADAAVVKVKVDAREPGACIEAVRRVVPRARLIVDPNESWSLEVLRDVAPTLRRARVDLLEQPLPADDDDGLVDLHCGVPVCADEACHVSADLPRLRGRYQAVNIKLDKAGGLTEAWRLLGAARADGFAIMVGCMVGSSLGIAPALELARDAAFVDLDGPLWLERDYPDGVHLLAGGRLAPPAPGFWGG